MSTPQPLFPHAGPSTDHTRPSLFDLLAQEQLRDLFHPVVRYVLSYFAQRYPRYLLRLLNHHEEFFALLLLLLERHHLKRHNASISEHFYGLRIFPSHTISTPRLSSIEPPRRRNLSRKQGWGLLLFLVGLPYLRARTQDYYERLGGGRDEDDIMEDVPTGMAVTKGQRAFKLLYPYINLGIDLTFLGYDIAYLFDKSDSYRPWHRWLGLRVARRGPDDEEQDNPTSLLSRLPPLLPPLLLALKLSQWWYSPSSPRSFSPLTSTQNSIAATHASILPPRPLPILPESGLLPPTPPQTPPAEVGVEEKQLAEGIVVPKQYVVGAEGYGKCPLCRRKWQNPAVLPSGWVVCWRCGWDAVEGDDEDRDDEEEAEVELGDDKATDDVGKIVDEVRQSGTKLSRRKGRCPITGVVVGPGELRRVLV
ncbi:hypothetical protein CI109_104943 [Kwoniella shandongensis]|uniref:Peroxisome assembly protein 12 n=1 Tax=Kwoniella shandongensis TaxID=1734106 RepID=A0A5M6BRE5_9TREE|nr:uncharacterized protein CI109_006262 [Kwoniella shandongensis]KAA5525363.1 hypothetical protein CI109_006262 [Kwoniella shandongensis]